MYDGADYAQRDRQAAINFCRAAVGMQHVVYLGGLQPEQKLVSPHLHEPRGDRQDSFPALANHRTSRGPIIGSGSASFEMVRYLTERLPVMVAPGWVQNEIQPIAVRDVLAYLIAAMERVAQWDCGNWWQSSDLQQMMEEYAQLRGLRRVIISQCHRCCPPAHRGPFHRIDDADSQQSRGTLGRRHDPTLDRHGRPGENTV